MSIDGEAEFDPINLPASTRVSLDTCMAEHFKILALHEIRTSSP